jgi:HSP20 family molecular chaperone IbpA
MSEKREMTERKSGELKARAETEAALRPQVDVFEDANGITLHADMPGVSRDRLNLQVDGDTLLIEGEAKIDMPEGMEAIYADVRSTQYRRSFTLSNELESGKIDANLKDGVLTVSIPKREEVRPRRIEVNVA